MATVQSLLSIVGALGVIATVLAHLPFMPARSAQFFARFGLATQKFSVNQRVL
jgi:hypothetical protein